MDGVSRTVDIPVAGKAIPGFVSQPNAEGVFPGMVVIQEWWGLTDHIREVCMRLARQGYVAAAPDLYHGKVGRNPDECMALRKQVTDPGVLQELDATVAYLKGQPNVRGNRIGVIGFCFGGHYSFRFGCHSKELAATVVYYGAPVMDQVPNLNSPILGIYGEADASISMEVVGQLRDALRMAGKTFEVKTYPGAQHAFNNDTNPDRYHAEASKDAWNRTLGFLQKHLKS